MSCFGKNARICIDHKQESILELERSLLVDTVLNFQHMLSLSDLSPSHQLLVDLVQHIVWNGPRTCKQLRKSREQYPSTRLNTFAPFFFLLHRDARGILLPSECICTASDVVSILKQLMNISLHSWRFPWAFQSKIALHPVYERIQKTDDILLVIRWFFFFFVKLEITVWRRRWR